MKLFSLTTPELQKVKIRDPLLGGSSSRMAQVSNTGSRKSTSRHLPAKTTRTTPFTFPAETATPPIRHSFSPTCRLYALEGA